jgi:hypothetical protein
VTRDAFGERSGRIPNRDRRIDVQLSENVTGCNVAGTDDLHSPYAKERDALQEERSPERRREDEEEGNSQQ